MAGDWIKMRKSLPSDPRLVRIMSALKADRFRTLGGIMSAWCLLDDHTEDGRLDGYTPDVFDSFIGFPGLCQAMIDVGWIRETPQGIEAVNFTEHNGQTAKRRAQDSVRKMSAREADKKRTREEKRREEINTLSLSDVRSCSPHWKDTQFRDVWARWLSHVAAVKGPVSEAAEQQWLYRLADYSETAEAIAVVAFSLEKQAKNLILTGDHKQERQADSPAGGSGKRRSKAVSFEEGLLK